MTGTTLNGTAGALLNTTSGGTLNVGYDGYLLDGLPLGEVTAETATDRTVGLTIRVETKTLLRRLRRLKSDEGKVDALTTDDGGFAAIDRASGGNTYTLSPPPRRQPLRPETDVHVLSYDETLVSQEVDEWDVELELQYNQNRTDSPTISQTPATDEWGFDTRYGQIATDRVSADFLGTGRDGVERFEIGATLTFEQAHVFEAALNRLGAVRIQTVVDGSNRARDESSDGAASVTIDASDNQDAVADGEYSVEEWSGERLNDAFQRYEFVVIQSA